MKIENVAGPSLTPVNGTTTTQHSTALERAKAAFMKPTTTAQAQAQQHPVSNPTSLSPEEYGAAMVKSGQSHSNESVAPQPSSPAPEAPKADTRVSDERLSNQYAALARKEKALRLRDQQLKAREEALAKPATPAEPPKPAFDESKYVPRDRLTQDPFSVLGELGLTYDQLTELALNAPKPEQIAVNNQIKALQDEIKALKGQTEETKKSFEQQQEEQNQQAINMMKNEARKLVKADASFELVRSTPGAVDEIVKLIETTYYEDGDLLTVEEAAQQVEDHLMEEAMRFTRLGKIQQKLKSSAPVASAAAPKTTGQPEQQQLKTLTNSVSSTRKLSAKERALLAFRGELKKD